MNLDHGEFFDQYKHHFGSLVLQSQVDGIEFLLNSIQNDAPLWHGYQTLSIPTDQAAYMLATVKHETGLPGQGPTFQPIDELGGDNYFNRRYGPQTLGHRLGNTRLGDGARFHGRGYVQLTGRANYARGNDDVLAQYPAAVADFETRTGQRFDLVTNPDQAKDPAIAYCIMSFGMRQGRFTGRKLADFFNATRQDPLRARQIINGLDRAQVIASYWTGIAVALRVAVTA